MVKAEYARSSIILYTTIEQRYIHRLCIFLESNLMGSSTYRKIFVYSKTCLKRPLKKKTKNWFSRPIIA